MNSFDGKVVLVTGGSSGIGADVARHLAQLGAEVAIVGRNEQNLNKVAEDINNSDSPTPLTIVADVTTDAERIVNETIEHFDQLDVLINSAGIAVQDNTNTLSITQFDRVFDVNVRSVITLTKLCIPYLEKTKGCIVNVSSISGLKAVPNLTSFGISKAALDAFTKSASMDLASKGIRVNSVNAAMVRTNILETMEFTADQAKEIYEQQGKKYPLNRVAETSDTSAAIGFLANNDLASFITGVFLAVDGGISNGLVA